MASCRKVRKNRHPGQCQAGRRSKGATRARAEMSALMQALEFQEQRAAAERRRRGDWS